MIAAKRKIGSVVLELHMRHTLMSDFLSPNFTLAMTDQSDPKVVELCYLGQNGGHAQRKYERYVDNALALEAVNAWGGAA